MNSAFKHDPIRSALEIREQLSSDKRKLGFFMGAGTSMAVGVPGIDALTTEVQNILEDPKKAQFKNIISSIGEKANVEEVLNRVRLFRELLENSSGKEIEGLNKDAAKNLDADICKAIYRIVHITPPGGFIPHMTIAQWLHILHMNREYPVEIFTTNYDLILERAMEEVGLPFFDGFVGAVNPFFVLESVEADGATRSASVYPPKSWTRLWKLHGSIGWHLRKEESGEKPRITRLTDCEPQIGEELMIFPSREKYIDSRRLPFLTYQDKLRKFCSQGEAVLFILGYSFSDEHINEIVFQGMRSNSRLAVAALIYGDKLKADGSDKLVLPDKLVEFGKINRNMSIYGPDKAVIGGIVGEWEVTGKKSEGDLSAFWDDAESRFTLGDFKSFASYLDRFILFQSSEGQKTGAS